MYDNSIIVAPKDGKFTIETNCLGFGLEPMPGNRGKYPVTAIVNGNTTRPLTIEDGHIYTQETRIRRIEVVDLTAGWDADRWRITLKNECGDSREVRHPTNNRGELIAARPGASTLFVIDSRIAGPQFLENLQEFEGGDGILRLMVTPDQSLATQLQLWTTTPDIGSSAPGEAAYYAGWDVGDASQVLFGVDVWCSQVGRFPGT
ncbi:MAG TPA: hypothetical protein VK399_01025, partial [Longimicrobiaceae bacterium]|nr:hypothetical protein [Longimicrobiaceae bacterium]